MLAGLRIAKDLGAYEIVVYNDSSVIVGQILGFSSVKEEHLAAYLLQVQGITKKFKNINLH